MGPMNERTDRQTDRHTHRSTSARNKNRSLVYLRGSERTSAVIKAHPSTSDLPRPLAINRPPRQQVPGGQMEKQPETSLSIYLSLSLSLSSLLERFLSNNQIIENSHPTSICLPALFRSSVALRRYIVVSRSGGGKVRSHAALKISSHASFDVY